MSGVWVSIEHAPKDQIVDLWGSKTEDDERCRWPDCWWSGTFQFQELPDGWYCRLGGAPFRIWATHFMEIPEGPK